MATTLTESDVYSPSVQVPDPGDDADQAAWAGGAQPLANRTHHIHLRVPGVAPSYRVRIPLVELPYTIASGTPRAPTTNWELLRQTGGLPLFIWIQTQTTTSPLFFPCVLPDFGRLQSITARLRGANHSALPTVLPRVGLAEVNGNGTLTEHSTSDTSSSVADYQTAHEVTHVFGTPLTLDYTANYFARIVGESGTNAVANGVYLLSMYATIVP